MPVDQLPESGRYNVRSSFEYWLASKALPASPISQGSLLSPLAYSLQFEKPIKAADLTGGKVVICAEDLGDVAPGAVDTDDLVSTDTDGTDRYAKKEGSLIEISIWASSAVTKDADARVLRVRDVILQSLRDCGRKTAAGAYIVDPMTIYDFATGTLANPTASNQIIKLDRTSGIISETHPGDPGHPEWRAWTVQVRLWYFGFFA